jgi:hypothetical protein
MDAAMDRAAAAAAMGRAKSPAKTDSSRRNGRLGGRAPGFIVSQETRAKLRAAAARRVAAVPATADGEEV